MWINHPAHKLYHLYWSAIDWLYPPGCGGCKKLGDRWCSECQRSCIRVGPRICPKCGNFNDDGKLCSNCSADLPAYEVLRSWGIFIGPLREAIHALKYQHDLGLGEALSKHLIETYMQENWKADTVVPVPLSPKRLRERGYNQAGLLAWPTAMGLGLAYQPKAIVRSRETRTQVGLKARERVENVQGAFTARKELVCGRTILLIDDVTTTGATLAACAQAAMNGGAKKVIGLTLARSSFGFDPQAFQTA